MVWVTNTSQNIPTMGLTGQLLLFALLGGLGLAVSKKIGFSRILPAIFILALIPFYVEASSIQLNSFSNGDVADADEVNENFQNLKTAIEDIIDNGGIGSNNTQGPQGPKGDRGDVGAQGPQGIKGDQGDSKCPRPSRSKG